MTNSFQTKQKILSSVSRNNTTKRRVEQEIIQVFQMYKQQIQWLLRL